MRTLKSKPRTRKVAGNSVVELPICIWLLFLMFFLPLSNLALIGMRSFSAFFAARAAASAAGRCLTFEEDSASDKPSAKHVAPAAAARALHTLPSCASVQSNQVRVSLISVPLQNGSPVKQDRPLAEVDTEKYVYQIEVTVAAEVEPLLRLNDQVFGAIPGLTRSFTVQSSCRELAEHPKGLTR